MPAPYELVSIILRHRQRSPEQPSCLPAYARNLKVGGEVWLSGFYAEDIPHIEEVAKGVGLQHIETRNTNEWHWMRLTK